MTSNVNSFIANLPIVRAYLNNSVSYHVGSVWGNRIGLQVLRTACQHAKFTARRRTVSTDIKELVEAIERDGVVAIENFLEPSRFKKVEQEFERAFEGVALCPYKNTENGRLYRSQIAMADLHSPVPVITEHFQRDSRLNNIASALVRRKVFRHPDVHLDWYQSKDLGAPDNDIENILHADLHAATIKMFYYLTDADETNGAFVYAKGSHQPTINRLRHEYELSIRQAKLRSGRPTETLFVDNRGTEVRNLIHPKYRRLMNIQETQICVKANTLVIANNMGFHRRGEFTSDRPRKTIQLNYRYLEVPFGKSIFARSRR